MSRYLPYLVLVAFLPLGGSPSIADEPPKKPGAAADHQDSAPSPRSHVEVSVEIDGTTRGVHIHREDETANRGPGRYYHRPILALVPNPHPKDGYPPVVYRVDTSSDSQGFVILTFNVEMSSDPFRQLCADAVRGTKTESDYMATQKGDPAKVHVMRWPTTHLVVECKIAETTEILGIGESDSLSNIQDNVMLGVKFTPANLARFLRSNAEGLVRLIFYYTYAGRKVAEGSTKVSGLQNVVLEVEARLTAAQKAGIAPIFQRDRESLAQHVSVRIVSETRLQNKELFPLIRSQGTDLLAKMMDPVHGLTVEELKKGFPEIERQLASYLKPHLETALTEEGVVTTVTETREDEKTDVTQMGGGFGINFPIIRFGVEGGSVNAGRVLDRLQKATGVSFKRVGTSERYAPHDITVYKMNDGWKSVSFSDESTTFLAIGAENRYLVDSPVPLGFTSDIVGETARTRIGVIQTVTDRTAPVGVVFPYMGEAPEELETSGWMLCDGRPLKQAEYPQVFQRIGTRYGKGVPRSGTKDVAGDFSLPNLMGQFLRGATPEGNRLVRTSDGTVLKWPVRNVASYEDDTFQAHGHSASTPMSGAHEHNGAAIVNPLVPRGHDASKYGEGQPPVFPYFPKGGARDWHPGAPPTWLPPGAQPHIFSPESSPVVFNHANSGAHRHPVHVTGATSLGKDDPAIRTSFETRSRNVAVYWIIRVH